jgi:hypothetical protein
MKAGVAVYALLAGGIGEALFPSLLIRAALGIPREFCPTGALAVGIAAIQAVSKLTFVFACLWMLWRSLEAPFATLVAASLAAVATGLSISMVLDLPAVSSWIVARAGSGGAAWDVRQWGKAVCAGSATSFVVLLAPARPNNELQRTRPAQATEPRR